MAGIPHVWLYRRGDPHYHTSQDRLEYVSSAQVELAGRLVLHLLLTLTPEDLDAMAQVVGVPAAIR